MEDDVDLGAAYASRKRQILRELEEKIGQLKREFDFEPNEVDIDIYSDLSIKFGGFLESNRATNNDSDSESVDMSLVPTKRIKSDKNLKSKKLKKDNSASIPVEVCNVESDSPRAQQTEQYEHKPTKSQRDTRNAPSVNQFAILDCENPTPAEASKKPGLKKKTKSQQAKHTKDPATKARKPPPIICYNLNIKKFREFLASSEIDVKFTSINTSATKSILKPETLVDHKTIFELLNSSDKVTAFTFTPSCERTHNLLLKGIQHAYTPEEVLEALTMTLPETVKIEKVKRFETATSRNSNRLLNAFIVQFPPETDLTFIKGVKYLLNQRVRWEYIKKSGVTQCRNCQHFGHIAKNCSSSAYRCVKCCEKHQPGQCPRTKESSTSEDNKNKVFCVNCKTYGHPANYRGCSIYKKHIQEKSTKERKSREQKEFARKSVGNYIQLGKSFASVVNSPAPHNPPKSNASPENKARKQFGTDLISLIKETQVFIPRYEQTPPGIEREAVLLNFLIQTIYNGVKP